MSRIVIETKQHNELIIKIFIMNSSIILMLISLLDYLLGSMKKAYKMIKELKEWVPRF